MSAPLKRPWYGNRVNLIVGSVCAGVVLLCGALVALGSVLPDPAPKPPEAIVAPSQPAATTTAAPRASSPIAPSTTPPAASTAPADPDRMICKVTSGGVYYLNVTSATAHDFSVCDGAEAFRGTTEDLLSLPGMDRRCLMSNDWTASHRALAGVYSDTVPANLAAARAYCVAQGGTDLA